MISGIASKSLQTIFLLRKKIKVVTDDFGVALCCMFEKEHSYSKETEEGRFAQNYRRCRRTYQ